MSALYTKMNIYPILSSEGSIFISNANPFKISISVIHFSIIIDALNGLLSMIVRVFINR